MSTNEPVIVSSNTGDLRIEAVADKNGNVCFKTYFRNNLLPQLTVADEPPSKLSILGICAYYVTMKESIRSFLHTKMSPPDTTKILGELVKDMAIDIEEK